MTIRSIPLNRTGEQQPETVAIDEVAKRMDMSESTVRAWIRKDMQDGGRRIPGGRCEGQRYIVLRSVFDRALRDGREPEPVPVIAPPEIATIITNMRRQAMDILDYAAELEVASLDSRKTA